MMNERDFSYPILVDNALGGPQFTLRPDSYQRLLISAMEQHRVRTGTDMPTMVKNHGVSWLLLALAVEIRRPIRLNDLLSARTWNTARQGLIFRREVEFTDEDGTPVMVAAKFHGTFDCATRHICRDEAILSRLTLPEGERLLEAESRHAVNLADFVPAGRRTIPPSWIDFLEHVNNMRYGEMIYDALTPERRAQMAQLRRLEIYFTGEIRPDDTVLMYRLDAAARTEVAGVRERDGRIAFSSRLYF